MRLPAAARQAASGQARNVEQSFPIGSDRSATLFWWNAALSFFTFPFGWNELPDDERRRIAAAIADRIIEAVGGPEAAFGRRSSEPTGEDRMAKNDGKPWTRDDVKTLRQEARDRNVSTDEIAKHLGRTVSAVRQAAHSRGISLKPKNR